MGFSPFFLLYGQPSFLPVDLLFPPKKEPETSDRQTYAEKWTKRMPSAFEIAQKKWKIFSQRQETLWQNSQGCHASARWVLVRKLTEGGRPGKLQVYWEQVVHCVVERSDNGLVYKCSRKKDSKHCVSSTGTLSACEWTTTSCIMSKGEVKATNQNQTVPKPQKDKTDSSDEEYTYQ